MRIQPRPGGLRLVIGSSHVAGMENQDRKGYYSYLSYPGFCLSNEDQFHLIKSDLITLKFKYNILTLTVAFGTNDAHRTSTLLFPDDKLFSNLEQSIVYGNNNACGSGSIEDPLDIISHFPPSVMKECDEMCDIFFQRVEDMVSLLLPSKVSIILFPGRFLKGIETHVLYNLSYYYFRNRLYMRCSNPEMTGTRITLSDLFSDWWCRGSIDLLKYHSPREVNNTRVHKLFYCTHGGVHYHKSIYKWIVKTLHHI